METPKVNLTLNDLDSVYEPAEDSFLLIDALEMDLDLLKEKKPAMCLEIGTGSGVVITALAMELKKHFPSFFFGIEINPRACKVTQLTSSLNNVNIDIVQTDLLSNVNLNNVFDVVIFNPPYVVTDPLEVSDDRLINKTWAGGYKGRQVMDRSFPFIPKILSEDGLFYLLVIKENEPEQIINHFKQMNMIGRIVAERKIRGEHLHVLRFQKLK